MPALPTVRNANGNRNHGGCLVFLRRGSAHKGLKALKSWLGFLRQASAGGDERAEREEKLCLQIWQSWGDCSPDLAGGKLCRSLLTDACLICCHTKRRCTCENPCADYKRRVNYICISRRRPANPCKHTRQWSARRCVCLGKSPPSSSHSGFVLYRLQWQEKYDK